MRQNQVKPFNSKSSGNGKTASEKEGKNNKFDPSDIFENLSEYLKKFSHFKKYEKQIRKKYAINPDDDWSDDNIQEAWENTKTMYTFSGRRKCWSLSILLQVIKKIPGYDDFKSKSKLKKDGGMQTNQPSGGDSSAVYISIPFLEMVNNKECISIDTDQDQNQKNTGTNARPWTQSSANEKTYKLIDKVPSCTQILQKNFYTMLYDNRTRNAAWVYEILNKHTVDEDKNITKPNFKMDPSVHQNFQASAGEDPYTYTGYDRGHLAAARNHKWCQKAYEETFLISNIVPQQNAFNRGMWRALEELCRNIAKKEDVRNVHVYTGPLYLPSDSELKDNNDQNEKKKHVEYKIVGEKAVPTHLFKVIIVENNDGKVLEPECYRMPNKALSMEKSENDFQTNGTMKNDPTKDFKKRRTMENSENDFQTNGTMRNDPTKDFKKRRTMENSPVKELQTKTSSPIKNTQQELLKIINNSQTKLKPYKKTTEEIKNDSGLIFEEREVKEEMIDRTWNVQWGENPDENQTSTKIIVRISSPFTDYSDRAVLMQ